MRFTRIPATAAMAVALLAGACGGGTPAAAPGDGSPSSTIDLPAALTGGPAGCSSDAVVTIGLYADDTCTAGTETAIVDVDTTASCVAWPGGGSISTAECYTDRVCMTHVDGDACDTGTPAAAEARTGACLAGPTGSWMKILDGTGNCPVAPDDFVCEATPLDAFDDAVCPID